ncbi:hypothetical protein EN863_064620 [Mesorhizobium sp. M00.F.Ca.ET.220.01.1.1]|nr:hypothetical protein EN863_064620 [Mesorhizobium sp. M00.F.Ca.ET.220.01.1.1]
MSERTVSFAGHIFLANPPPSDWECRLIGGPHGVVFRPAKGCEPNAFHRLMQRLAFGIKWRRNPIS